VAVPTNLEIDDRLLARAQKLGGHKTKKATVNEALTEFVQRRAQRAVLGLFGTVEFDPKFDYKRERARR
jgi:Arc/MetJ family transcription regulator